MARILMVDDEPGRVFWIRQALQAEFGEDRVSVVSSASDAIRAILDPGADYDLLFWDLHMPMDDLTDKPEAAFGTRTGLQVFDAWRRRWKRRPAVLLTQVRDDAVFRDVKRRGSLAYSKDELGPRRARRLARRALRQAGVL